MTLLDFSVIVPTYRRRDRLHAALGAFDRLDWPNERWELIVVDDGSPPGTEPVFEQRPNRRLIRQEWRGPAAARNRGAEDARGRFLAFTDDDCEPEPGWLSAWAEGFERTPSALLGGRTHNALPDNPYSTASEQLLGYIYLYYNHQRPLFFASNNIALPTKEFRALGGFDTRFPRAAGEDRDFCRRWKSAGRELCEIPNAVVRHAHPLTLRTFLRQHYNYGRGAALFHQRSAKGPEPLSFYLNLLRHPMQIEDGMRRWRQVCLMIASQLAVASGFLAEARRR